MGIMLSLSGIIAVVSSYIIRIYISNLGGLSQVGLYTAGFAIINTYVGMIFTAMGTEYYPRLAGLAHDNIQARQLVNHQAEIAILILAPILCIFLIFVNWVIIILYSSKFIDVNGMLYWAALGMYFKAASWPISFVFLAKGDSKTFFLSELAAYSYILLLNVVGYKLWGLDGLGISFLISYIIYYFQVFVIAKLKYAFSYERDFYRLFLIQLLLGLVCFILIKVRFTISPWFGLIIIITSLAYSFIELNKRIDLKGMFNGIKEKYLNK
jgi:O-antigen/teichoic acid export membrane protein